MDDVNRFTIEVHMVNEATESPLDIADMLDKITGRIRMGIYNVGDTQSIIDYNGNRVGGWKFHIEGVN